MTKSPGATSDDTSGLVAQQEGEVVVDAALSIVQVRVAHPTGLDLHDGLARPGVGDDDVDELDGLALGASDDGLDGLGHEGSCRRVVAAGAGNGRLWPVNALRAGVARVAEPRGAIGAAGAAAGGFPVRKEWLG
jgi:hypothetical protein